MSERPSLGDDVRLASEIAGHLRAAGIDEDDPHFGELLASETDVQDRLRRIIRASRHTKADAQTLAGMIDDMRARKTRLEKKADGLKAAVAWAMAEIGMKRIEAADFTASLGSGKAKVVITDADALPDECCVIKREPSKVAIAVALEEGPVAGAEWGNPEPVLTVRTR